MDTPKRESPAATARRATSALMGPPAVMSVVSIPRELAACTSSAQSVRMTGSPPVNSTHVAPMRLA